MTAARASSETFSNVDAAWLHMEKRNSMAMITGVMMFDQPIDFDRLRATIENRLLPFHRFCQRVREPALGVGLPTWETDPNFDLDHHLLRVRLPEPADQQALQDLVSQLMSTQLDFSKPLWQYHYVENFGDGSALVCRLHHCIADGLALVQVLLSLTDPSPDFEWSAPPTQPERKPGRLTRILIPIVKAIKSVERTREQTGHLIHEGMDIMVHPTRTLDAARLAGSGTRAFGKLLLIGPDQKTIFKGRCGEDKTAAWSHPLPLEDIKSISKVMNGTINDVLLSAVTGSLRRYLEARGEPVEGINIRALVPVNLRPPGELESLGNRFGLVFLSLPVGERDPLRRLMVLKKRMDKIKDSPEAVVAFGILNAIGMTPKQIEDIIVRIFGMKGTAVMTNVPGPRAPIYLAGAKLDSLMFWVPSPANLGMGVSILSYAGKVFLGVATDACLVPDPECIIQFFHEEVAYLKQWGRPKTRRSAGQAALEMQNALAEAQQEAGPPSELPLPAVEISPVSVETAGLSGASRGQEAGPTSSPAASLQVVEEVPGTDKGRCQAQTRAGQPCKNRALPGSPRCRVHQ